MYKFIFGQNWNIDSYLFWGICIHLNRDKALDLESGSALIRASVRDKETAAHTTTPST